MPRKVYCQTIECIYCDGKECLYEGDLEHDNIAVCNTLKEEIYK